jgi:hypothetical protein
MELRFTTDKYNVWYFPDSKTWNVSFLGESGFYGGSYYTLDSILKLKGINTNELVKV